MAQFEGKVALVTGAGSGIGRATALAFAREGAEVVVSDVTNAGAETVQLIEAAGGSAVAIHADVADETEVRNLVEASVKHYGRLDFAFNNAGIAGGQASVAERTTDNWNQVIGINLTGVWLCMKYEIPRMLAQGGGVIVNNASILGLVGFQGAAAYVASKHGVLGLTKTAALEYAEQGIRVNAICPGFIHTPMVDTSMGPGTDAERAIASLHAMNRMGSAEEIASGVIWICSEGASFYTGQALVIDGGFTAR